jgi:hypothetical protein
MSTKELTNKKNAKEEKKLLPGNIALDSVYPKDEEDWRAKMQIDQLRARVVRKHENYQNMYKAYSSPKSEEAT